MKSHPKKKNLANTSTAQCAIDRISPVLYHHFQCSLIVFKCQLVQFLINQLKMITTGLDHATYVHQDAWKNDANVDHTKEHECTQPVRSTGTCCSCSQEI